MIEAKAVHGKTKNEVTNMLIQEVSKAAGLTKKAVEYYTEKGMVTPAVQDNGYRDYGEKDAQTLKKIGILRKLGLGMEDIRDILQDGTDEALEKAAVRKELETRKNVRRNALIRKLGDGRTYAEVETELRTLEMEETIGERLLIAFPGFFGRFVCIHFSGFLNEPVETEDQREAYETILSFLDHMPTVHIPEDVEAAMKEEMKALDTEQMGKLLEGVKQSIREPEAFLAENQEVIEWYLGYRRSKEYQSSAAGKWMEYMREFQNTSGYTDIFLPAMRRLSPSYEEYCSQMDKANEQLLGRYPEAEKLLKL